MLKKMRQAMRRGVGPMGLSLAAAAVTAVAFAAVSIAAGDGDNTDESGIQGAREALPAPPALSEEDEAKLEEFRSCMEENGAPAPPEPGEMRERMRNGELPDPPSEANREKLERALEACRDKLPEDVRMFGPGCGPGGPGGPPPARGESGGDRGGNQGQGFVIPAPAPSGTS